MSLDRVSIDASVAVTTGVLTLTSRVYANPAMLAAFSAITGSPATVTITLGTGNKYMDVVTVITPDAAVGVYAESKRFVADHSNVGAGTLL